MKSLKKAFYGTLFLGAIGFVVSGSMNSIVINKKAFLKNDLNIKFAKRLDDMKGEIVIGRMAASIPSWRTPTKSLTIKKEAPVKKAINKRAIKIANKIRAKQAITQTNNLPAAAIKSTQPLSLTGGFYNKKPLDQTASFSGNAKVTDGVIETLSVTLPDGESFSVNSNIRMVGNVFEYEDSNTREMRSGLFYVVKKGHYMVTLTDDSSFSGMRLEFMNNKVEREDKKIKKSWAMNKQNVETNPKLDVNNYEDDSYEADQVDQKRAEWAEKQEQEEFDRENSEQDDASENIDETDFAKAHETEEDLEDDIVKVDADKIKTLGTFAFNF
ncbi:MAG: hypothetical protein HON90_12655 [Halobacteriovoraceae bacterium]|jgi:hypothetical protein|nr:hypothetical protein [Halobacteriovoraceae bacterium]